jgi:hypothetical protein
MTRSRERRSSYEGMTMKAFLLTTVVAGLGLGLAGAKDASADHYHGGGYGGGYGGGGYGRSHSHHHHGGYGGGYRGGYGGQVIVQQPYVVTPSYGYGGYGGGCNYPQYISPGYGGYSGSGVSIYGNGFGFNYWR